jgi:hypothetical protein
MSDTATPYQSPETAVSPVKPLVAQGVLTETMLMYLKGASPWLRFIGIVGLIGCGLSVLGALTFFMMIPQLGNVLNRIPGMEALGGDVGAAIGGTFGANLLGFAVLFFFPFYWVYNFGSKIRIYLRTGTDQDLENAFKNNKSLWRFMGILAIIILAFIPLMIIGGIIAVVVTSL